MKMQLKLEISFLFTFLFIVSYTIPTDAYCSLERMKKFAFEACEHLFPHDEIREKRSIDYNQILNSNEYLDSKKHSLSRSNYPRGGYLKMNRETFLKLSQKDVKPRYKARKMHLSKHERFKRDNLQRFDDKYVNISYCCFHKCEEDFFC